MTAVVVVLVVTLVFATVPKLVRAQGRGRALTYQMGAGPLLEPRHDSTGFRRVNLGNDHFTAGVISARLTELGIQHSVYPSGGGEVGALATQMLLYDEVGDDVVREVLADLDES